MRQQTHHSYDSINHRAYKRFTCQVCHKPGRRAKVFSQTVNPFNKNADGTVKTVQQIVIELENEAARWQPTIHAGCGGS